MKRVVITGMGAISPFGRSIETLFSNLVAGRNAVTHLAELESIAGLRSFVGALAPDIDGKEIPRKFRRSMSRMSIFATLAAQEAIEKAGVTVDILASGSLGISLGSTIGSPATTQTFFEQFINQGSVDQMKSTTFFQIMNHSCAANVAQTLGITGRILAPSAACATGCQAIGYGYEMIVSGRQDLMLCGGADELHPLTTGTFDLINAASTHYNNEPHRTPRPFDRDRDGVVCGEGAGVLLLESVDSATQRGAHIYGEILGFATTTDTSSIANPDAESIRLCMEQALTNAAIGPDRVDYINAHATGTEQGDIAESQAIAGLFGAGVPASSLKGHLGHTMAASGALETIATMLMINDNCIIPTKNLEAVDERCAGIHHPIALEKKKMTIALKNNFALGGVNACIVLRRYYDE